MIPNFDIISWKAKNKNTDGTFSQPVDSTLLAQVEQTLFCSLLGALRSDRPLLSTGERVY